MRYSFRKCVLDAGARSIKRDGFHVHTEPQVFDLLVYLIENRGRIVDKDELFARVWKGRVVSDATLSSRINAVRAAVGDDGRSQRVVATHSGKGYRFVADVAQSGHRIGRPAVAVLPLKTADPAHAHLARGLADELAALLGQASWFDVRDSSASFAPVLSGLATSAIAERLDVGYLISGTLLVNDSRMKLSVRLVSAEDDRLLYTETFESSAADLLAVQDAIAAKLLGQIEPRLRHVELQRSEMRHGTHSAFDHYLRASDALRRMDLPSMHVACAELDKAVEEHPEYAAALGMRAWIATLLLPQGRRVDQAVELARSRKAVTLGAFDCEALSMGGYALGFFDRHPLVGLDYVRRAIAINPSSARAHDHAGWLLLYSGHADEARRHFDRALSLCPIDEFAFRMLTGRAFAHLFVHDHDAAIDDAYRARAAAPDYSVCLRVLTAALAHAGRSGEATKTLKALLRVNPNLSVSQYARDTRFESASNRETLFAGLRKAGMA